MYVRVMDCGWGKESSVDAFWWRIGNVDFGGTADHITVAYFCNVFARITKHDT